MTGNLTAPDTSNYAYDLFGTLKKARGGLRLQSDDEVEEFVRL